MKAPTDGMPQGSGQVTPDKLKEVEEQYQKFNQVHGVSFVALPNWRYASDNDNALYTGMYLGAAAYRYAGAPTAANQMKVEAALEGIKLLTTVSGTPGVLARWAFPLRNSWELIGYHKIKSLESETNTFGQRIREGQMYERGEYAFQTKTTKDQISGVLFGLTAAWTFVPRVRPRVKQIVSDLAKRFDDTNWSLKDHEWKTGTSAHKLDSPLKLIVKSLYAATHETGVPVKSWWFRFIWLTTLHYNRHPRS